MKYLRIVTCLLLIVTGSSLIAGDLPRPSSVEPAVKFWTRIYTEVDTNGGLIHDDENLEVVYEVMRFSPNASRRYRHRAIKRAKRRIKNVLRTLAKGKRSGLSAEEKRVLNLWPQGVSNRTLRRAVHNVRFQLGQANKYKAGLVRSGQWREFIRGIFESKRLPTELSLLPHVESSFNPKAYSKVGAAGLWQFTRSTGRRYMRIDHIVDERMDPFKATEAAASLLKHNYSVTGTWPLAITAYNHGAAGMRRASSILGTKNIATIIKRYKGRTFGFASRNFYVAFLAAVDVDQNADKYFGKIRMMQPVSPKIVKLPRYLPASQISDALGVNLRDLREANPALRPSVWSGSKYIPKDFQIYVPQLAKKAEPNQILASIPSRYHFSRQRPDVTYRVRRGNTLSQIARRFGTSVRELMRLNNLRSSRYLRVGQVLRLPQRGGAPAPVQVASRKNLKTAKYKVRRGDTLYSISRRFGISQRDILALNNLRSRHRIYAGQVLRIKAEDKPEATKVAAKAPEKKPEPKKAKPVEKVPAKEVLVAKNESAPVRSDATVDNKEDKKKSDAADKKAETKKAETKKAETKKDESEDVASKETGETTQVAKDTADAEAVEEVALVKLEQQENEELEQAEPARDDASNEVTPGLPGAPHTQLAADPSDYEVADNKTIQIQAEETLGHYAEWLDLRASRLRRVNKMRYGTPLVIGRRLKLDFSRVDPREFEQRRIAYHRSIQEAFFEQFHIKSTKEYKVRRGQTLWYLTKRKFNIPVWLLRQHNPDVDFSNLKPNTELVIPVLEENDNIG